MGGMMDRGCAAMKKTLEDANAADRTPRERSTMAD
jgi:hypothetical protein